MCTETEWKYKIVDLWLQSQYTKSKLVSSQILYGYSRGVWIERLVQFHEQEDAIRFRFSFGLMIPIKGGWVVELSRRRLRKKSAKRSRTTSSPPPSSACTGTAKDSPPMPTPPVREAYKSAPRDYNLPIPSWMAIPDDYERDDDKDDKF